MAASAGASSSASFSLRRSSRLVGIGPEISFDVANKTLDKLSSRGAKTPPGNKIASRGKFKNTGEDSGDDISQGEARDEDKGATKCDGGKSKNKGKAKGKGKLNGGARTKTKTNVKVEGKDIDTSRAKDMKKDKSTSESKIEAKKTCRGKVKAADKVKGMGDGGGQGKAGVEGESENIGKPTGGAKVKRKAKDTSMCKGKSQGAGKEGKVESESMAKGGTKRKDKGRQATKPNMAVCFRERSAARCTGQKRQASEDAGSPRSKRTLRSRKLDD